jgi:glyoxylase-like metal-dependent hydrolase (beta-lactamase superfamily II)
MWVGEPGKINERLEFLGTRQTCLYLVKGKEAMIIGGGMAYVVPWLERQFSQLDLDAADVKYLVIPHSHFDHCGAVPYLQRRFPRLRTLASEYCRELFSRGKVINAIASANERIMQGVGLGPEYQRLNLKFEGVEVQQVVKDGDVIDLGDGIQVRFLETPGHTRCSIAAYVTSMKAMFPSDAVPVPLPDGSGLSFPSPQYDFSLYLESLKKLSRYEVEICAFEHNGVYTGDQASVLLSMAIDQTEQFRHHVLRLYEESGDLDKVARRLLQEIHKRGELSFLDPELQSTIVKASIRKMVGS